MTVKWNAALTQRVEDAAFRGAVKGANRVRNEVLRLILRTPKTGRIYYRRGKAHQASAPGEAPASDTGNLVRGFVVTSDRKAMRAVLTSKTFYGPILELGRGGRVKRKGFHATKGSIIPRSGTLLPRPHMRPAVANTKDLVIGDIATEIRNETKKRSFK